MLESEEPLFPEDFAEDILIVDEPFSDGLVATEQVYVSETSMLFEENYEEPYDRGPLFVFVFCVLAAVIAAMAFGGLARADWMHNPTKVVESPVAVHAVPRACDEAILAADGLATAVDANDAEAIELFRNRYFQFAHLCKA